MSLDLQWSVLRSNLPPDLKSVALVLALIAKNDGTSIWVRVETLAAYLGLHRVTVSKRLTQLDDHGDGPTYRVTPRLLRRTESAGYLNISGAQFDLLRTRPQFPRPIPLPSTRNPGRAVRTVLWDRADLDRYIDSLKENTHVA